MFTLFMMSTASLATAILMYVAAVGDSEESKVVVSAIFIVWALGLVVSATSLGTQEYMSLSEAPVKAMPQGPAEMPPSEAKALLKPENTHPN